MPKLDDLLGIAPTKPARVKLDDLLGTAPAPSVASPPKVKLDDLLGDGPSAPKPNLVDDLFKPPTLTVVDRNVPRPAPIRVDTPKPPAPLPTAGGWVGNMQRRAREAIAGERPFVNPTTGQAAQGEMKGRGVQPEVQMPRPDLEKLEAERKARLLVKANEAAANPNMKFGGVDFAPIAAKELAKQAGVDPEQIAKLGREQYKGGPTVTGFPTPPREIPTTESPDLVRRREQLAARQGNADRTLGQYVTDAVKVASGQPLPARPVPMDRGESGVAPRNSYGTTGSPDIFGLDYNPLGAVVGAADEVYREAKSGVVPLIEGITGQKSGIRTDIGFLPKTEAPSINVGRNLAGAPYAIAENLGGKVAPALNKIQQEGIGAGINEALGKNDRKFGGLGEESTYKGDALDAIADSVINAPGELFGLAMVPVHGAIGAYNLADNLGRGDITPKEVWKAPTDAATGMVGGMVRDVAALAMDPKQKLSEGAFSTLATVAPFTGALRSGLGVDSLYAKSARAAEDANAIRARPDVAALQMEGIDKLKAARGAESAEFKAGNALEDARARLIDAGPNPPKPLFSQLIERNAEHVKAREAAEAARKVLDEFEAEHRPRLDKAFADVAKGYKEASALEAQALGRHIVSRLPSYYATLGVTAVTDALGILAGRAMRGAGKGGWRWVLDRQGDRLPELAGIMREMGREGHSESAILETAYRKLPPELRPEVRKALMMEHTLQEGGFYRPGNDYARHIITNMDGNQWEFTPYGKRWLKEQEDIATTARAEMNAATDDAIAAAARDRMNTALDNIQKAETHVEVANKYGTPFSMSSTRASAAEAELGIIDPSDAAEYEAFRTAQIDKLKAEHEAFVKRVDAEYQKVANRYTRDAAATVRDVEEIAGRVIGRASERRSQAVTEISKAADDAIATAMARFDADLRTVDAPLGEFADKTKARAALAASRAAKSLETALRDALARSTRLSGADIDALMRRVLQRAETRRDSAMRSADRAAASEVAARQAKIDATIAERDGRRGFDADAYRAKGEASAQAAADRITQSGANSAIWQHKLDVGAADSAYARAVENLDARAADTFNKVTDSQRAIIEDLINKSGARSIADVEEIAARVIKRASAVRNADVARATRIAERATERALAGHARDIQALDRPFGKAVQGVKSRAQRIIDRAQAAREKAIGESLAQLGAEIYAIEAAPVPNGFRRVQWRQVIDKTARDERIQETRSDAVTVAASSKNTLGPTTQLDQLHRSMMRAEQMPVRRRELQYNLSDNFGQEVQALQQRWNDIATFRLYKELADRYGLTKEQFDAQRAVDVGVSNAMGKRIDPVDALSKATETDKRYIRVPEQAKFDGIEGSPPMYGALSGKFIPEDLWYELVNSQVIKEEMANSLNRGLSMLKVFKTVLSPVTTARNFWTNALLLAPMAGVSLMDPRNWPHFWEGLKEFVSKDKSPFYRAVEERGLFDSGFHRNEMALKVLDDVHSGFVDHVAGPLKGFAEGFAELLGSVKAAASKEERIARKNYQSNMERLRAVQSQGPDAWLAEYGKMRLPTAGKKAKEGLSKITEATRQAFMGNPGAFYAAGDDFFRYVLAKKMAAQGHSINRIIETGRNAFGNYADNPGFVQVVRAPVAPVLSRNMAGGKPQRSTGLRSVFFIGGQPFIAYSAWAIPHVKKWAQQNPWRFMLMDNLHETVSRANLASIGLTEQDERDIISANAISKPWEAGRVLLATIAPRLARDEQGGFRTLDAAYMSPLSNVAPNVDPMASKGGQAMQRATSLLGLNGGMLFQPIMDVVQGRDSFTGREIITDAQRPAETAASVGSYLYRAFMPPWMPSPTDVFGGEVSDLKDPARWTGGSYYEQGAAAVTGQPNYTGQKRTVGEFAFNTASGAKLGSVDMTDTALQGLARLGELFSSADILATASKGQGRDPLDPNMDDDTREALAQDYRDRVQERVQQFRDTITRLGGNVAADNDIITGLADSLGDLQDEEDPWTYYRLSRRIVNRYMGLLRQRAADYREKRAQAMGK